MKYMDTLPRHVLITFRGHIITVELPAPFDGGFFAPRFREMTEEEQMFGHFRVWMARSVYTGLAGAALMACAIMPSRTACGGVIIEDESCGGPGGTCGMMTVNSATNVVAIGASHDETSSDTITFNPDMAYLDMQFRVENEAANSVSEFFFEQDITNLSGHDWTGFRHVLGFTVDGAADVFAGPDFLPSNDADGLDFNQTLTGSSAATSTEFSTSTVGNGGYDTIIWGEAGTVRHGETTTLTFTIDVSNFDPLEMPGDVEILEFDPVPFVFSGYTFTLRQWPVPEPASGIMLLPAVAALLGRRRLSRRREVLPAMFRRRRPRMGLMAVLAVLVGLFSLATPAWATRVDRYPTGQPSGTTSFVRDGTFTVVADDVTFASDLDTYKGGRWKSIDSLMQICFGGGFIDDIEAVFGAYDYTFASAAMSTGMAWNLDTIPDVGPDELDNFSRAWRANAAYNTSAGMLHHFYAGAYGVQADDGTLDGNSLVIAKGSHAVPSIKGPGSQMEFPQYSSRDATNDARTLGSDAYAILVQWDELRASDARHLVNIQRMYDTLTNVYNVDPDNIVVLSDAYPVNTSIPARSSPVLPDTSVLGAVPINGNNSRASWISALDGSLFGNTPLSESPLFTYHTGHGGRIMTDGPGVIESDAADSANGRRVSWSIPIKGNFEMMTEDVELGFQPISADLSLDGQVTTTLHLEFRDQNMEDSYLRVNDTNLGRIANFKDDNQQLEAFIPFLTTGFTVQIPVELLRDSEENLKIDLLDPESIIARDPLLLSGMSLRGGDQEFAVTNHLFQRNSERNDGGGEDPEAKYDIGADGSYDLGPYGKYYLVSNGVDASGRSKYDVDVEGRYSLTGLGNYKLIPNGVGWSDGHGNDTWIDNSDNGYTWTMQKGTPEPSSLAMVILGGFLFMRRHRH